MANKKYKYLVSVYKLRATFSEKLNKVVRRWIFVFGFYCSTKAEAYHYVKRHTALWYYKASLQKLKK